MTDRQKIALLLFGLAAVHTVFCPLGALLTLGAGLGVICLCMGIVLLVTK